MTCDANNGFCVHGCNSDADCLGSNEKCDIADKICRVPCRVSCPDNEMCDPSKKFCVPVCSDWLFRCEWPDLKCNLERGICGKQCTENRNCKEGEFCDTRMGVCVPGCDSNDDCVWNYEKCDLFDRKCKKICYDDSYCKPINKTCDTHKKLCVDGLGCKSDEDCNNGKCDNDLCKPICATNQDCKAFNMTCNLVKNVCEGKADEIEFCTAEFFDRDYPPSETPSCYAELLPLEPHIVTTTTTTDSPSPTSDDLDESLFPPTPKTLCSGDLSFKTVYGQRCKARQDGVSSCMMGSEGFSWCSTEHMWYRDDHWYDWDTCSLCLEEETDKPLTSSGLNCTGPCKNDWFHHESLAPRCETGDQIDKFDFCTNCEGETCPDSSSAPRDERGGNVVDWIKWN